MGGSSFTGYKRRFRTTKELAKHLTWLCRFGDSPALRCSCKHCGIIYADRSVALGAQIIRLRPSADSTPRKRGQKAPSIDVLEPEDLEDDLGTAAGLEQHLFGTATPPSQAAETSASTSIQASSLGLPKFIRTQTTVTTIVEETVLVHGEAAIAQTESGPVDQHYIHALADRKGKGREMAPFRELLMQAEAQEMLLRSNMKRKAPRKSRQVEEKDEDSDYGLRTSKKRMRSMAVDFVETEVREESVVQDEGPSAEGTRRSSRARKLVKDYYEVPAWYKEHVEGLPPEEPAQEKDSADRPLPYIHKERYAEQCPSQ